MPTNFKVQATVVDLRHDSPLAADKFWVDTNVWLWMTYPNATISLDPGRLAQTRPYTKYLQNCYKVGGSVYWNPLQLSELGHQIEKMEFEIAKKSGAIAGDTRPKEYRHNYVAERQRVAKEIQTAWQSVCGNSQCLQPSIAMDEESAQQACKDIASFPLDGHDLYFLQSIQAAGMANVLSDDGDLCTVPGITLFTANKNVIETARAQSKLKTR